MDGMCDACLCGVMCAALCMRTGLFAASGGRARRLRELVVDLAAPLFGPPAQDADAEAVAGVAEEVQEEGGALNPEQREAVDR